MKDIENLKFLLDENGRIEITVATTTIFYDRSLCQVEFSCHLRVNLQLVTIYFESLFQTYIKSKDVESFYFAICSSLGRC